MNRIVTTVLLLATLVTGSALAAETSVHGRLYTHWEYDLTDGADGANSFELGRAYVTLKSKLSEFASVRITSDLRETTILDDEGNGKTRFDVIIKYGYLDWKPAFGNKTLRFRIGLQPTPYIDYQNKLWGRRYIAKTVGDINKFLTTSDLGASANFVLGEKGKYGSLTLGLFNGTSYSNLGEANKHKDVNLFAQINPLVDSKDFGKTAVVSQYYKGTQNKTFDDSTHAGDFNNDIFSIGGIVAYRGLFHVGADLNWHTEGHGVGTNDQTEAGVSFYGTLYLAEVAEGSNVFNTLNLFGRYDSFDPDTDRRDDAKQLLIVGVECNPTKGFKTSVNIRTTNFDDSSPTETQLFVNTLFKF